MNISDPEKFAVEFAETYLGRGFGSMNKNEMEVLLFYLFKKYGVIEGSSIFQMARELRLPESKIRRLAYEAELSFGSTDKTVLQTRFLSLLGKAKIQKESGTLRFVVEDKFLRSTIYEDLKQEGYYLDSSFNSEIVSIHKEALIALLDMYYKEEQKADMLSEYKRVRKEAKKADAEGVSFKEMMSIVFDKALDKGIDAIEEVNFSSLIKAISSGIVPIISFITKIATGI